MAANCMDNDGRKIVSERTEEKGTLLKVAFLESNCRSAEWEVGKSGYELEKKISPWRKSTKPVLQEILNTFLKQTILVYYASRHNLIDYRNCEYLGANLIKPLTIAIYLRF